MKIDREFHSIIREIVKNHEFNKLKAIKHHRESVFHHSLEVAYLSYLVAKKFGLDYRSAARAGMLHDFFLYDWREPKKNKFFKKHGFTHAAEAHRNAMSQFNLNRVEEDAILKHMFPLNLRPPASRISWIVTGVDKYVSTADYVKRFIVYMKYKSTLKKRA